MYIYIYIIHIKTTYYQSIYLFIYTCLYTHTNLCGTRQLCVIAYRQKDTFMKILSYLRGIIIIAQYTAYITQ